MEREILQFLRNSPGQFFSAKEVGKKLDRKEFAENPHWARIILHKLAERNAIVEREDGYFYYPKGRGED